MMVKKRGVKSASPLREVAEPRVVADASTELPELATEELLHKLRVHQIELEMQNEELRRVQLALEESRNLYLDLYEFAPVGYLTLTDTGRIAEANLTAATLLGVERKKLLHSRFARFVISKDQDTWQRHLLHASKHGGKQTCEMGLQRRDGTVFNARLDCLLPAASGAASTLRIALSDITDIKRAMAKLQSSEERLRLAKITADLGIYDYDVVNDRFVCEEHVREFWGSRPDEPLTYAKFIAGIHVDDRIGVEAAIGRALDPYGTGEYHCEYRVINCANGRMHHLAAHGQAFFEGERAVRFVGTVKDISVQKRMENELQGRRNAMELLVSQQVAAHTAVAIAHELNQPLVAVSAYSEAALQMLRGGTKSPEKLMRALEGAVDQAQRAGRTLHELLAFLTQRETTLEPTNLNDIVREALAIAAESGYGGFHSLVELERDLPPVMANCLQIKKVLVNLLYNGVEAMREAGVSTAAITITVRTRTIAGRNMAQVTVQDSGPGLDAKVAHLIFDPFFTTKPKGIGLGLAISRALVEAHGGQLWADLERSPGATFHFTLPFAS